MSERMRHPSPRGSREDGLELELEKSAAATSVRASRLLRLCIEQLPLAVLARRLLWREGAASTGQAMREQPQQNPRATAKRARRASESASQSASVRPL